MKEVKLYVGDKGGTVHACACIGKQGSDLYCPCEMRNKGLQPSLQALAKQAKENHDKLLKDFKAAVFHPAHEVIHLLDRMKKQLLEDPDTFLGMYTEGLYAMLDDIRQSDGFGTEGQLDPRND